MTITATSNNTALIPNPTIIYTNPNATGTLVFTPVANLPGTVLSNNSATITVVVTDNGTVQAGGGNTTTQTFVVNVTAVNQTPTLSAITSPQPIFESAAPAQQTINLSGITAGPGDTGQILFLSATSSNTSLIPNPSVTYTSNNPTGSLTYTPVAGASGTAVITVTVMDNGGTANNASQHGPANVHGVGHAGQPATYARHDHRSPLVPREYDHAADRDPDGHLGRRRRDAGRLGLRQQQQPVLDPPRGHLHRLHQTNQPARSTSRRCPIRAARP